MNEIDDSFEIKNRDKNSGRILLFFLLIIVKLARAASVGRAWGYLLYKTLRSNQPYAVRHASECPSTKIFRKFLGPGEQAALAYPGPKISGKFWGLGCAL